jgi:hypothetical protein
MKTIVGALPIVPILVWLAGAFIKITNNTFVAIQQACFWFWGLVLASVSYILGGLGPTFLPEDSAFSNFWAASQPYLHYVNAWVPLVEGFTMFVAYVGFYVIFIPAKITLRHLPFVGG